MLTRANFSMETVNHVVKSFYREEDIRQQDVSQKRSIPINLPTSSGLTRPACVLHPKPY
jgi:hypothetical protein